MTTDLYQNRAYSRDDFLPVIHYGNMKDLLIKRRMALKNIFGNKCNICNFNKHTACLDFHHVISEQKLYILTEKKGMSLEHINNYTLLDNELCKVILVCKNCHTVIHCHIIEVPRDYLEVTNPWLIMKSKLTEYNTRGLLKRILWDEPIDDYLPGGCRYDLK